MCQVLQLISNWRVTMEIKDVLFLIINFGILIATIIMAAK